MMELSWLYKRYNLLEEHPTFVNYVTQHTQLRVRLLALRGATHDLRNHFLNYVSSAQGMET